MGQLMTDTEMLQDYGTTGLVNPIDEMGKLGQRNMQFERADRDDAEAISGETLRAEFVTEDTTCANCAVKCGKHVPVEAEEITEAKIPELETLFGTATMQEVYDLEYAIKVNDECDRLGLDTISSGVTVAFARECYEKGLLEDDVSPNLEFGDGWVELTSRLESLDDARAQVIARAFTTYFELINLAEEREE